MEPIRIIVVEDHSVGRMSLRTVLADQKDIQLVAESDAGTQASTLVERHKPDVLLIGPSPDGSNLNLIREVRRLSPSTQTLVLTSQDSESQMLDALAAGATGYIPKESHKLILQSIRTLHNGGCTLEKRMLARLLRLALQGRRHSGDEEPPACNLSERELAVLRLISQGSSNRVIGEKLHLAEATVKKYVHSLKSKLSVSDRAEAAVVGLRLGLLE